MQYNAEKFSQASSINPLYCKVVTFIRLVVWYLLQVKEVVWGKSDFVCLYQFNQIENSVLPYTFFVFSCSFTPFILWSHGILVQMFRCLAEVSSEN